MWLILFGRNHIECFWTGFAVSDFLIRTFLRLQALINRRYGTDKYKSILKYKSCFSLMFNIFHINVAQHTE